MPWIIVLLTLIEFSSAKLASIGIYWNASNPIFRIDNTDHIIDVNRGNNPFEYDQVNIICPTYTEGTNEEAETYIIYNVSKEEYDSCRITNSNPRIIAICDKPHQLKYFTITFRSFTPQPGGLEFKPGQDYYFISTSTGKREGLDRRLGGRCSTHHMKVIFKVCCSTNDNNVLNDKSDANNIKNNSNINSTINSNQSFSSTTVDSSSLSSSELSIESSSSSSIASSSLSSASSSPLPAVTSSNLIFTLTSSPSPSIQSNKDFINSNRDLHSDDRSNANGLYLNANINNVNPLVSTSSPPSTSTTLGSLVTSTFPASPEHWWRPHFTRIQDLKWRSKGPGNVVKETNHHHLTDSNSFTNPNANNSQNNSSNDTLRPIAWTIFAIACFIFIIFWALWCKVRRNNVMLPMSK